MKLSIEDNSNAGLIIGIMIGLLLGLITENLGLWLSLGVALGAAFDHIKKDKNSNTQKTNEK